MLTQQERGRKVLDMNAAADTTHYTVFSQRYGESEPGSITGCVGWDLACEVADEEQALGGREVWIQDDYGEVWI